MSLSSLVRILASVCIGSLMSQATALASEIPSACQWVPAFTAPGLDGSSFDSPVTVHTSIVFDDGSGARLWFGGSFENAGPLRAKGLVAWDGLTWSHVKGGLSGIVYTLALLNRGAGPELYVGGEFTLPGVPGNVYVAKWNGAGWTDLGGPDGPVASLAVYNSHIIAGGNFDSADGIAMKNIAKWNGAVWSAIGGGVQGASSYTMEVTALAVLNLNGVNSLYAGGNFTQAGSSSAAGIAKWDGIAWSPVGSGISGHFVTLATFDDGTGPALFAGGYFSIGGQFRSIAKWQNNVWTSNPSLSNSLAEVESLFVLNDGSGPALYVGGWFLEPYAGGLAKWDNSQWVQLGVFNERIRAAAFYDNGKGNSLYAGGGRGQGNSCCTASR